jgi:hypothetical protein
MEHALRLLSVDVSAASRHLPQIGAARSWAESAEIVSLKPLAEAATSVYNKLLTNADKPELLHLRALCLSILSRANTDGSPFAGYVRRWNRVGLQFVVLGEADEAERCFSKAESYLGYLTPEDSLQARLELHSFRAHHAWVLRRVQHVFEHLEEARLLLHNCTSPLSSQLAARQMYITEHVAFRYAKLAFRSEHANDESTGVTRADIMRLVDLGVALLDEHTSEHTTRSSEAITLRDKMLRLHAWIAWGLRSGSKIVGDALRSVLQRAYLAVSFPRLPLETSRGLGSSSRMARFRAAVLCGL